LVAQILYAAFFISTAISSWKLQVSQLYSSGSSLHGSTPRKSKTNSHSQYADSAEVGRQDNPVQMNLWKQGIIDGYSRAVSVDEFFSSYMVGDRKPTPAQITEIVKKCRVQLEKAAKVIKTNMIELKMYPTFVSILYQVKCCATLNWEP
jgi:hypothetical protein